MDADEERTAAVAEVGEQAQTTYRSRQFSQS